MDKALAFEGATTQVSWDNVTGKPEYYPPENHAHSIDQIEDLYEELRDITTSLDGKAEWPHKHDISAIVDLEEDLSAIQSDIANKANIKHTHEITDVNNLQTQLNGKASASHSHAISDVTNLQTTLNGKAASSHNHSASNITSGTLPVTRGGTGITANPSMLVDLNRTTAASVFASAPRPGVIGTLPVARGGTGVTSLSALKTALGISSSSNTEILRINLNESHQIINPPISLDKDIATLLDSVTFSKTINRSNIKCTIITANVISWYNRADHAKPYGICNYTEGYSFTLPNSSDFILYDTDAEGDDLYFKVYLKSYNNSVGLYAIATSSSSAVINEAIDITIEIAATYT